MNLNTGGWASRVLTPLLRIIRTSPNATVPVIAISEPVNSETAALVNADIAIVAKGLGATLAQVPDGTAAGGDKRGPRATDLQKFRSFSTAVASGSYSVICGGQNNLANNSYATVAGGNGNSAIGDSSAVVGGGSNTASSSYGFVGGGQSNTAQSYTHATVCGGSNNMASGQYAFVGGGQYNTANSQHSAIMGGRRGTTRSIIGYHVFPACNAPIFDSTGLTQSALLLLGRQTTNATPTVLASDGNVASTTNQVILPNNAAYSFTGEVIAGVVAGGNTARWTISGAIKRGGGTTAMVGTPTVTMTHNDAGAAAWVVNVTADTTNGGIAVTVTGAASTTIRWVCKINTTEMTF